MDDSADSGAAIMANTFSALDQISSTTLDLAVRFGPRLIAAIVIVVVGISISRWTALVFLRLLTRIDIEPPVRALLVRIIRVAVVALFAIVALQNIGVELLPLIAGLGVIGAGVALAMQGLLSDVAAGLSIIFAKPFRVGEYISLWDEEGQVNDVTLFNTVLTHPDGSRVVIPNRKVAGEVFHNYGGMRQLQLTIYVGYDADLQLALSTIHEVLDANCRVLREPVALVQPVQLAEWSVEISARPWVLSRDGFAAKGEIHCQILERFRDRGIVIPVPKRELRIVGEGIRPFTVIQGDRTG